MNIYTIAFFGHRQIDNITTLERRLEELIRERLLYDEYVVFLVARNGAFDLAVSSTIRRLKHLLRNDNSTLTLMLPYLTEEYRHNQESFENYYDEIELCNESSNSHFKKAITIRNQHMIDRADLVVVYIEHNSGGAYTASRYAKSQKKPVINLANYAEKLRKP